jgi:glycosidase
LTTESGATISVSASAVNAEGTGSSSAKITTDEDSSVKIYISAASAPTIWVWQPSGLACCTLMGYTWTSQPTMSDATGLNYEDGWYVFTVPEADYTAGKAFSFILNSGSTVTTAKTATFWYDAAGSVGTAGTYYDSDPTTAPTPVAPSATITPSTGSFLPLKGSIVITLNNGYSTISSAAVTVKNTTQNTSLTYRYSDFTSDKLSISVPKISAAAGDTVTVSVSVTNAVSTIPVSASYTTEDVAVDKFTWDNALVYFVLTDRFYNGDTSNDHSYNRVNNSTSSSVPDVATFHGGDIEGLTDKIDYIASLGVNAIWITAPYEQIHGWVSGKDNKFPHYAFHGYYTLDWTEMDKNMGTVEQFRTFVKAAHNKGIRVIMDIVMNHTGYNTVEDMITYNFGSFSGGTPAHGWIASTNGTWQANTNGTWSVLWGDGSSNGEGWENWWCSWVRAFNGLYGYQTPGSSDETMSLAGLPDVYTESSAAVSIPTFLAKKWSDEGSDNSAWRVPAAADYRVNVSGFSPHDYTEHWLASWVREFGVDGFRVDTAKHVERVRWGELKDLCQSALEAWRADSTRTSGDAAKDWTQNFWMTGECFGWTSLAGAGEYYTTGKFDSMINFSFNGSSGNHSGSVPTTSTWATYANALNGSNAKDSDSNGNHNNVLSYISSHDTGLTRTSDQSSVGTMLCLLPGGVQIFYGDESSRGSDYSSYGDTDMETRTDMNWSGVTGTYAGQVAHWGKVGTFRKNHPAVGAGTQTTIEDGTYGRTYSGTAGDDRVVIHAGSASKVKVSGFFDDGTEVENSYTGETATVSNGSVTFATASNPVLIEAVE